MDQSTSNEDEETTPCCQQCETRIEDADRRRVVSAVEDGKAVYRRFCSAECLANWTS